MLDLGSVCGWLRGGTIIMNTRGAMNRRRWVSGLVLLAFALMVITAVGAIPGADAQTSPSDVLKSLPPGTLDNVPPSVLQNLPPDALAKLKALQQAGGADQISPPPEKPQTFQPVPGAAPTPNGSRLENIYSIRAGQNLEQFGYKVLGVPAAVTILQSGAVQDDYVLGIGDQIQFDLRGQENASYTQVVDSSGRIVLPKLAPIPAAGRSFADFRGEVERRVAEAYVSTKVFLTLADVRQASVLVSGSVRSPGVRIVSGMATPLDAILLSGGIDKTGSLRSVKLIRGGSVQTIDLYSVIARGTESSMGRLRDGDRIFVPQLGATVAIAGSVRRPAIYELAAGQRGTSVKSLLSLAGGVEIRGSYRLLLLRTRPDGKQELDDVTSATGSLVHDGELLIVESAANDSVGRVTLLGDVKLPGQYALGHVKTLHDLLPSAQVFGTDPYLLLGVILREDPQTLHRVVVPFSPLHVVQGSENVDLISKDEVHILTISEMRDIANAELSPAEAASAAAASSASIPTAPGNTPSVSGNGSPLISGATGGGVPQAGLPQTPNLPATAGTQQPATGSTTGGSISGGYSDTYGAVGTNSGISTSSPAIGLGTASVSGNAQFSVADQNLIGHVIGEYAVVLGGAVRDPGVYLVMPGTTLDELVIAANGLDRDADLSSVEITSRELDNLSGKSVTVRRTISGTPESLRSTTLGKYDQIVFRHVYSDLTGGQIVLTGEFRYPGTYGIIRGERLSSVIARAGGLTEVAYPAGAVYTRPSVAALEQKGFDRAARQIQEQLAILAATPRQGQNVDPGNLQFLAGMALQLKNTPALGRVAIVAEPTILATKPELDPILENGDALFMPRRPSSVTVSGEVLNPGSFLYRSELGYEDYIKMAGGDTEFADSGSTFIVLPDGSAIPASQSWITFGPSGRIPPGSAIVVPRNLRPFDFDIFLKDAVQTFSILAVTAATIATVSRNN